MRIRRYKRKLICTLIGVLIALGLLKPIDLAAYGTIPPSIPSLDELVTAPVQGLSENLTLTEQPFSFNDIPEYNGNAYCVINNNRPTFTLSEYSSTSFIELGPLDELGRCTTSIACIGKDVMPGKGEQRGEIGQIKPTGWHTIKYPDIIEDLYLYNRCHCLAWCLTGLNAESRNLITGTRSMNLAMTEHELQIARYIERTGNHIIYRVTPVFVDNELVCRGLHLEAASIEDNASGICFNVYYYNTQPGITIDYATGDSSAN